jgi:hypothetical protein
MICRHDNGDPSCTSGKADLPTGGRYYPTRTEYITEACNKQHYPTVETPDSKNYDIEAVEKIGPHLVLKVSYPNCKKCAYEGNKIMVFLNTTELDVLRWKEIDPHFRPQKVEMDPMNRMERIVKDPKKAPSPAARFPASDEGWKDAIEYTRTKSLIGKPGIRG